jgi:hypothetical protein
MIKHTLETNVRTVCAASTSLGIECVKFGVHLLVLELLIE